MPLQDAPLHYLVVTLDTPPGEQVDAEADTSYSIECPGVTDACRAWRQCAPCRALSDDEQETIAQAGHAHGVAHLRLSELGLCHATDVCFVATADNMPDQAEYIVQRASLGPGRYPVGFSFEDEESVDLWLIRGAS